jgi:hypothetical protein
MLLEEGEGFPRVLWGELYDSLMARGMHWRPAFHIALRQVRLAIYLLAGLEQRAAARALGVSERTAKYDAQHLSRVLRASAFRASSGPVVLRLPLQPEHVPAARRRPRR